MKILLLISMAVFACLPSSISGQAQIQNLSAAPPCHYSLRTFAPYHSRLGFESLPIRITSGGGGKLGPNEKFKLHVSGIKNDGDKTVTAVKITFFIFKFDSQDELVESTETAQIPVELMAGELKRVDLLVGYVDDIPLLCNYSGQPFMLEMAITEAQYDDGSVWRATDLPQKQIPASAP